MPGSPRSLPGAELVWKNSGAVTVTACPTSCTGPATRNERSSRHFRLGLSPGIKTIITPKGKGNV